MFKVTEVSFKVANVPIITAPIQQIISLGIASPTRIAPSLVSPRPKPVSEFSFFWDPEAEEKNEVASESATQVMKFTASVTNQVTKT